jgi:hypothetical protein
MARELVFGMWNYCQQSHFGIEISNIITSITYKDEDGNTQHCDSLPFHPIHDAGYVNLMRARFQKHKNIAMAYYIGITKSEYRSKQVQLIGVRSLGTQNDVERMPEVCYSISYDVCKSNLHLQE